MREIDAGFAKSSPDAAAANRPALALAAAIGSVSLVGIGLSLTMALLAVRLAEQGYSGRAIGFNPSAGGFATLLIATFVPQLAQRLGIRNLLFVAMGLAIASLTAFALYENYWSWLFVRGLYGVALTILFVLSEFWINAVAPPQKRGLILGIYTTSLAAGFAAGPTILAVTGTQGLAPFLAAIALFVVASVPVALVGGAAPQLEPQARISARSFIFAAPGATLAALVFGAIETAAMGLLPVYALRNAMHAETGALLVSLFAFGNVIFPIPMGMLSDRFDRRRLLAIVAAAGVAGAILLPFAAAQSFTLFAVLLVIWGGVVGSLYTLGLALLGERYKGVELAAANATYIMLYSVGMLAGPPLLGGGLDLTPPGLFWSIAAMLLGYFALALWQLKAVDSRRQS